jgi:HlyD family secretion protein
MSAPANPPTAPAASAVSTPVKKKSRKRLWIIVGSVLLVALIGGGVAAKNKGKDKGTKVSVEKAAVRTITHLVTATGKVQPETEVRVSPEVGGEIVEIPVKEGQAVKKGDLLVRIKPDFYKAQVEQQEASLAAAKASSVLSQAHLTKAQQDFKQANDLYEKKLISDADFTAARTNLDVAQADFQSSQAQIRRTEGALDQFRDQLNKTTLFAPMDGTISSLSSEVGERVIGGGQFAGTEIMRVADLDSMELRVKVNENDIVSVKIGDKATIAIDAYPGRKFLGAVREISNSAANLGAGGAGAAAQAAASVSDEVTNFLVKIRINDKDARLRPGMSATTDIETETVENVVSIPIQSVTVRADGGMTSEELQQKKAKEAQEKSGNELEVKSEREDARRNRSQLQRVVFIKNGDTVKLQSVETGIADNTNIEIKSGVKAGDEVVSGSYAAISRTLKDGMKVVVDQPKKDEKK